MVVGPRKHWLAAAAAAAATTTTTKAGSGDLLFLLHTPNTKETKKKAEPRVSRQTAVPRSTHRKGQHRPLSTPLITLPNVLTSGTPRELAGDSVTLFGTTDPELLFRMFAAIDIFGWVYPFTV